MLFLNIMHHYILWHYVSAFGEIAHISKNFFWFTVHFFSLPQLIRSYFAPWKRMTEERGDVFNFEEMAGFVIVNILSRVVGATLRTCIILAGLIAILIVLIGTIITFIFWVLAPAAIITCLILGITLLFS